MTRLRSRRLALVAPMVAAVALSLLLPQLRAYHASAVLILEPGYTTGFVGYAPAPSKLHMKLTCLGARVNLTFVKGTGSSAWKVLSCNSTLSLSLARGPFVVYVRVLEVDPIAVGSRGRVKLWLRVAP